MKITEIDAKNILTKSPVHNGYTANLYGGCVHNCMYCYARYLKDWTGHEQDQWGEYIDVKNWKSLTDKQKKELRGKHVMVSSACDPYQPVEATYKRTHQFLESLVGVGAELLVVTKSNLAVFDVELFKKLNATVAFSINTLDEGFRADMDKASTIEQRIGAMNTLRKNGVYTVCFISPIFPAITDAPAIIKRVTGCCDEVWLEHLVLCHPYKGAVLYYIKTKYPEYYKYYDRIFNKNDLQLWWDYDDYMEEWCGQNGYKYSYSAFPKEHREKPVVKNHRGHKGR